MWKIGLEKACNLKRAWELVGLMNGSNRAVIVVGMLLGRLVHMIIVCYLGNFCWSVRW